MTPSFLAPRSTKVICLILLKIWCQVPNAFSAFNCTRIGYFPDRHDPAKFYSCTSNSGSAFEYRCQNNQIFNATEKQCVQSRPTESTTTTQKAPTRLITQVSSRPRRRLRSQCFAKRLRNMIKCFKNESMSWKKYLRSVSSSNDTNDILKKALNNTDAIFSAFEKERNSSSAEGFNPFDVLRILDDIGRDVANKTRNATVTAQTDDIFVKISPLRLPYRFPDYSHEAFASGHFREVGDVIEFPEGMFNNNIAYHVVSALYVGLTDKLPTRLFQSNKSHVVNSHVISSLFVPSIPPPFSKNFLVILKHLSALEQGDYSVCAYWDYSLRINDHHGAWSREGCHVMTGRSNKTHTTCSCDHLTNFAILMGSENMPITRTHEFALSVITYIGCALSLFGSVTAIAILVVLTRGLQSDRNIIHANLLISIAISQTIFLAGVEQTQDRTRCKFTAIMLHYFYLVSFAWMLCEGFHLYAMVIKVFNLTSRVYHYVAFAWGLPAFIVLITAVCRFKEYGSPSSCWISTEYYTLLAFILPVALTLMVNIVILCLVMREICKLHVSESSHIKKMIK